MRSGWLRHIRNEALRNEPTAGVPGDRTQGRIRESIRPRDVGWRTSRWLLLWLPITVPFSGPSYVERPVPAATSATPGAVCGETTRRTAGRRKRRGRGQVATLDKLVAVADPSPTKQRPGRVTSSHESCHRKALREGDARLSLSDRSAGRSGAAARRPRTPWRSGWRHP